MTDFKIGDVIEGIDQDVAHYLIHGEILELDLHPLGSNFARIRIESVAEPASAKWVNLRLFRRKP